MLELYDIKKDYEVAGEKVHALKGVTLKFRKSEFVSILGPSGCGKTTLLNIIGGLDKYTSGDLVIEGISTKKYGDRDWDTYRNHSIGFIFQSYHLIPHQTILQNVELALMISGVSKQERRQRAVEALEKVGLKDKINNRPNQLSGGQAQRVAIARALINDPEIVLADEPTGALDSVTSVQIMELLKEIAKDRLVIMVTHNPELAEQYSTRIVRLLDGEVTDDSKPYDGEPTDAGIDVNEETEVAAGSDLQDGAQENNGNENVGQERTNKGKKKKTSMSIGMAMGLSCKNLLSKSKRTAMVSVAGSIGIIGVSLVLAISSGVQGYIHTMQDDMLSGNPVAVTRSAVDYSTLMDISMTTPKVDITKLDDKLYVRSLMDTLGSLAEGVTQTNEITPQYIDYVEKMDESYYNVIQYGYGFSLANNIYTDFTVTEGEESPSTRKTSVTAIRGMYSLILGEQPEYENFTGTISSISTFLEMPDNRDYVLSQFDVLAAETEDGVTYQASDLSSAQLEQIFNDKQSLVMVVDESMITDIALGQYGYFTQDEFLNYAFKAVEKPDDTDYNKELGLVGSGLNSDGEADPENGLSFTRFIGAESKKFTWYPNNQAYAKMGSSFVHRPYEEGNYTLVPDRTSEDGGYMKNPLNPDEDLMMPVPDMDKSQGIELGVKLILQKKKGISYSCMEPGLYHTNALTKYMLENSTGEKSEIVKAIEESEKGYLAALPYSVNYTSYAKQDGQNVKVNKHGMNYIVDSGSFMSLMMSGLNGNADRSAMLRVTAAMMGGVSLPSTIRFYPIDFSMKNSVCDYLDEWNAMCERGDEYLIEGETEPIKLDVSMKIIYTDNVGMIIGMVNTMIQMITIALVAFTALSLVVSTVMIGIITYVSVVERVKEIGILRAVGARKKDIKRLFNSETFIIGLIAGLFGILITYLLSLIINVIVLSLAGIWGIAALPWWQAVIMVAVSVALTLISGLIPAAAAAKKDPVVALRTE